MWLPDNGGHIFSVVNEVLNGLFNGASHTLINVV